MRQNAKLRQRNKSTKSLLRTKVKRFQEAIVASDLPEAQRTMRDAEKYIRRAVDNGPIHKNNASRRISRMAKQLAELESN